MSYHSCLKCGTSEDSGRYFFRCSHCRAEYCNEHAYEGLRCPECGQGFLNRP